jgi:predicted transcriptional regulator
MRERRKPGRPTGNEYPNKVFTYLSTPDLERLAALVRERGQSRAAVIREAVRELLRREERKQ